MQISGGRVFQVEERASAARSSLDVFNKQKSRGL